jgi:hypothetical protein
MSQNLDKAAASFCHQVAAWVLDRFCSFYAVNYHKIGNISGITGTKDKKAQIQNSYHLRKYALVAECKNNQILLK